MVAGPETVTAQAGTVPKPAGPLDRFLRKGSSSSKGAPEGPALMPGAGVSSREAAAKAAPDVVLLDDEAGPAEGAAEVTITSGHRKGSRPDDCRFLHQSCSTFHGFLLGNPMRLVRHERKGMYTSTESQLYGCR